MNTKIIKKATKISAAIVAGAVTAFFLCLLLTVGRAHEATSFEIAGNTFSIPKGYEVSHTQNGVLLISEETGNTITITETASDLNGAVEELNSRRGWNLKEYTVSLNRDLFQKTGIAVMSMETDSGNAIRKGSIILNRDGQPILICEYMGLCDSDDLKVLAESIRPLTYEPTR